MRYIKYIILLVFMVALVLLALANRGSVSIGLLPTGLPYAETLTRDVPLFGVIFAAIGLGLLLGYFLEYFREHKYRRQAAVKNREAATLAAELAQIKKTSGIDEDDVLALLTK
ncbi:MAG: lipopolysaccharide assembly protein LapA domain-containing protein [Rhodobacteraceae bacterium]|nr:lipopolysaccharide assembly protein LapA domain-containing protein [Paracoccaceae bacterium]